MAGLKKYRLILVALILSALRVSCSLYGPEQIGRYQVGDNLVTVYRYNVEGLAVDVRWPRHKAIDWVFSGWIIPGLQKTVIEFPRADSASVAVLNDSTIELSTFYIHQLRARGELPASGELPSEIDTLVLDWHAPTITK